MVLFEDKQYAVSMGNNPQFQHIDIKQYFIREQVSNKKIKLKYRRINDTTAGILTKGLSSKQFEKTQSRSDTND